MSYSIFGAEQRISEPLSALAVLSGPDQAPCGKKKPRPNFSQKSTNMEYMVYTLLFIFYPYLGMYLFKSLTPCLLRSKQGTFVISNE